MEFEKLVQQAESKTLEYKRDLSSLDPVLKTIVAFANTAGGVLIIGRTSDGVMVGVQDPYLVEQKLANAIADGIRPSILPEIEVATAEGKTLIVVRVAHWRGPFYLKRLGVPAGVYIRLGSTSRPASADMLAEMQRSLSLISFDQQPIVDLSEDDLDRDVISEVFSRVGKVVSQQKLRTLGLLIPYVDRLVPSIGAIILFGQEEQRARFVPDARVSCARFRGSDRAHIIDQMEVRGTIVDAVDQVLSFIARNTRLMADIVGTHRNDIPEYSTLATREALVNALVHADYTVAGSHTRVSIFSDRLEITNPGTLPFGYTMEDLMAGISRTRNRVIVRTFRELGLMEEWGSGYQRILADSEQNGYPVPEWEEMALAMSVTFYPHPGTVLRDDEGLTWRQERILELLGKHYSLALKEISHRLQLKVAERTLRHDLSRLQRSGLVRLVGAGPSARWTRRQ